MSMAIAAGQEMKVSVKSAGTDGNKSRTIRYIDPLAGNTSDQNVTGLVKKFMASSKDTYISTSGSIELGILEEA